MDVEVLMPGGPYFTETEKAEVWERRRRGESASAIARGIGRHRNAVREYLKRTGGVRPRARERSVRELSLAEREEISRGLAAGESCRGIAGRLGRAHTTASREVERNSGRHRYRAAEAEKATLRRHRRPKPSKFKLSPRLRAAVVERLEKNWSPEQISAWLNLEYPDDREMQVRHETIYLSLYVQSRATSARSWLDIYGPTAAFASRRSPNPPVEAESEIGS